MLQKRQYSMYLMPILMLIMSIQCISAYNYTPAHMQNAPDNTSSKQKNKHYHTKVILAVAGIAGLSYLTWAYGPLFFEKFQKNSLGNIQQKHAYYIRGELHKELKDHNISSQQLIQCLEAASYSPQEIENILKKPYDAIRTIINKLHLYGPQFVIPRDLDHNPTCSVIHYKSNKQQSATCGAHALFNAKAIQELIKEKKKLTAERINRKASDLYSLEKLPSCKYGKGIWMEEQEIMEAKQALTLDNTYIYYEQHPDLYNPKDLIHDVQIGKKPYVNFIVYTPSHWTLASVINNQNNMILIHMDSQNNPIKRNSHIYNTIKRFIE